MRFHRFVMGAAACLIAGPWLAAPLLAQERQAPLRWVVPFPPGGAVDAVTRVMAKELQGQAGRTVVVENRAGANTIIAADELARSAGNDTIMTADVGTLVFNPYLYRNLRYDVERDFSLAGGLVKIPMMLIAREGLPASSLEDLLRHEKSRTEALTYASVGAGSIHHLAMELLARRTGMTLLHVPYKGVGPAMQDVLAGRIDLMMIGVAGGMPHVAGGRVKALAVAADQPVGEGGKIPTFAASGLPGFEVYSWMAAIVPATADAGAKAGLERSLQEILARQEVRDTLKKHGLEPMPMDARELHEHLAAQRELWGELLSKLEIALD